MMSVDIQDFDYCLASDRIIYLVKGYYHMHDSVIAYPVYWPNSSGDRVHPILGTYKKGVSDFNERLFKLHPDYRSNQVPTQTPRLPRSQILHVWKPRNKTQDFMISSAGQWHDLAKYLVEKAGIGIDHIGIFGSYLVDMHRNISGQHIKDVDFVIYGVANLHKVRASMPALLKHFGYQTISQDHIKYHSQKFGDDFDSNANSFDLTLANKWSSIQMSHGLLATLRFSYLPNEIPTNPIVSPVKGKISVQGIVSEDMGVNFMPRVFKVTGADGDYTVVTYFWGFQACVAIGDLVKITGNIHADGKTISVDQRSHGIKIILPATKNLSKCSAPSQLCLDS